MSSEHTEMGGIEHPYVMTERECLIRQLLAMATQLKVVVVGGKRPSCMSCRAPHPPPCRLWQRKDDADRLWRHEHVFGRMYAIPFFCTQLALIARSDMPSSLDTCGALPKMMEPRLTLILQ